MKRAVILVLALLLVMASLMLLSPLRLFNLLTPTNSGIRTVAAGVAYGQGLRRKLDIYGPAAASDKLPILVFCYGGAWSSGDRADYAFVGKAFAAKGFLTVVFDYRLLPEVAFPGFVEDTAAAIAWVERHGGDYGGDASRIFLLGHSAGAYNVAMASLEGSYLARAGSSPKAIKGVATLAGPFDFLPLDTPATIAAFSAWPDRRATQPVNLVTEAAPPFLLLTGSDDGTVYPRNSVALHKALTGARIPATITQYPGIGHAGLVLAIARPLRWRAPVVDDVTSFFNGLRTGPE